MGPVWSGGGRGEDETLASCYRASLRLAEEHRMETVAFPAISTGAYRFPVERAARIAVRTTCEWLADHDLPNEVRMVCFDATTASAFRSALGEDVPEA